MDVGTWLPDTAELYPTYCRMGPQYRYDAGVNDIYPPATTWNLVHD